MNAATDPHASTAPPPPSPVPGTLQHDVDAALTNVMSLALTNAKAIVMLQDAHDRIEMQNVVVQRAVLLIKSLDELVLSQAPGAPGAAAQACTDKILLELALRELAKSVKVQP